MFNMTTFNYLAPNFDKGAALAEDGAEVIVSYPNMVVGGWRGGVSVGKKGLVIWVHIMGSAGVLDSQHLCSPREGHLDAVYRIFRYLQKNMSKNPERMTSYPMH